MEIKTTYYWVKGVIFVIESPPIDALSADLEQKFDFALFMNIEPVQKAFSIIFEVANK